ncbi:MAG: TolB protein [Nitrospirae bacterium]|nr:MAG: TolB protein [Nitrospirota bacterium]
MILFQRLHVFITFLFIAVLAGLFLDRPPHAHADKVFIDIASPGMRKLPIAVQPFIGATEVSDVVKADLTFTGLFECLDDAAQIEQAGQPFNSSNWRGLGVELVVKGRITSGLHMLVTAHDAVDGREVLRKEYSASSRGALRQLAHAVSNDVYRVLTGRQGIFRSKIAFVGESGGRKEIYIADWDGYKTGSTGISGGVLLKPRWSPDGSKLIYSSERFRQWDLFVLDLKTMREKHIRTARGLTIAGNFFPDSRRFVFSISHDGSSGIYTGDSVSGQVQKIASSPWIDVSPAVSPDGKSIAFVSNRSGGPQVFLSDASGYSVRRVTYQGGYNTAPAWSPAGDLIAYSGLAGGGHQIFVMKTDGSGVTQLTDRGNNEEPSFSPDGRYIAFMSDRDGAKGIYLMRFNGEGQMRITPRGIKATSPSWSPN